VYYILLHNYNTRNQKLQLSQQSTPVTPWVSYTQICVQANLWCTSSRARKVVISLTLGALTVEVINVPCFFLAHIYIVNDILAVVFWLIVPAAVLVINVVVAIQVRRAAIHSAANLGVEPHHHSTSAVPTIMLITTSLIYVLFNTMPGSLYILMRLMRMFSWETYVFVVRCYYVAHAVHRFIYAYNFFVYLITGKLFRSDLYKLLCRCLSSSSAPAAAHALAHVHGVPPPAVIAAAEDNDDAEVARRDNRAETAV